jgi:hypothetical protein
MIDLTKPVREALLTACPRVYPVYPNTFSQTPVISFYEAVNQADNSTDLLTDVAFSVDVWAKKGAGDFKATVAAADTAMRGLGFRRSLSREVPDSSEYRHQAMRFDGVYNAIDNKIYARR